MMWALLLSTVLFLGAIGSHLAILNRGHSIVAKRDDALSIMLVALLILASHLLVATWFAAGFWAAHAFGLGGFDQVPPMDWMDYFYFSVINITTLGLGDIYPTEHLRLIAGIEALTGFALISCSAQLLWSMMKTKGANA